MQNVHWKGLARVVADRNDVDRRRRRRRRRDGSFRYKQLNDPPELFERKLEADEPELLDKHDPDGAEDTTEWALLADDKDFRLPPPDAEAVVVKLPSDKSPLPLRATAFAIASNGAGSISGGEFSQRSRGLKEDQSWCVDICI